MIKRLIQMLNNNQVVLKCILSSFIVFVIALYSRVAIGTEKNQLGIKHFYKCYARLLNNYPERDHKLVQKIKRNEISSTEACMSLLDSVSILENGEFIPKKKETYRLVQEIQKFYNSWVSRKNLNHNTQDFPNTDIYDVNESAYAITYNLFTDKHYKSIFKGNSYFRAIRKSEKPTIFFIDRDIHGYRFEREHPFNKWKTGSHEGENDPSFGPLKFIKPPIFVEFGKLIGISIDRVAGEKIRYRSNKEVTYNPTKPAGGGIIGTKPFLITNSGQLNKKVKNVVDLHRRWSVTVFKDFLCQDLPLLTAKDVSKYIKKTDSVSFEKKAECMKCHVTMDFMAGTLRNFENHNTGSDDQHFSLRSFYRHPATKKMTPTPIPSTPSKDFHLSRPDGSLTFRDIKNNFINKRVRSIEELGQALSETDSPFYCAVNRHFEYLTGIEVPMRRIKEEISSGKLSEVVAFLKETSDSFKEHGQLKEVFRIIFNSRWFKGEVHSES